jgi:hypothetical protein
MNGPLRKGKNKSNNLLNGPIRKYETKRRNPFKGPYKKEAFAISLAVLIGLLVILLTSLSTGSDAPAQQAGPAVNQTPEIPTKTYAAGGVSFQYPTSWNITTDQINGTNMQLVVQDPTSASDPQSNHASAFTILKVQKDPYETLEQRKDSFIQSLTDSGANIAPTNTTNITVNGINATETIYSGNDPKYNKIQLKVVYFEQKDIYYIIAFFTKGTDLQSQDTYFNIILNSFKLQ